MILGSWKCSSIPVFWRLSLVRSGKGCLQVSVCLHCSLLHVSSSSQCQPFRPNWPRFRPKSKHLPMNSTKAHIVKAMVFPVVMYRCESWTIKKAEHQRTYAFKLWCWRKLLRVPWIARKSRQLIVKEINCEYSLEELLLKLLWPPDAKSQLIGKDPDAGKDWRQKEKAGNREWDD